MKMLSAAMIAMSLSVIALPALADSAFMTTGHTMRASKLVGVTVTNPQGETIGTIDDILVSSGGKPTQAVLNVGGYVGGGDKLVVVPLSHLRFAGQDFKMQATKSQLASMAAFSYHMASDSAG